MTTLTASFGTKYETAGSIAFNKQNYQPKQETTPSIFSATSTETAGSIASSSTTPAGCTFSCIA